MTRVDGVDVADAAIRPSYLPVLRAYTELVERGVPPTCANLAKELRVSRQAVWKLLQRHPDLREWIDAQMDRAARLMTGMVVRRVGNLAIQGSDKHADIYLRFMAGGYARPTGAGDGALPAGGMNFIINNLIPRPPGLDLAGLPAAPALPAATPIDAPTVEVR